MIEIMLLLAVLLVFIPLAMLFVECCAALWGAPLLDVNIKSTPRVAVLIPARNESAGLATMLNALLPELPSNAQAIVIADNCSDATAQIARELGVTVLERNDSARIGKSYALAYGIAYLAANPPEVVICLDADCFTTAGTLAHLACVAYATGRPVQAVYLLDAPPHARPTQLVSAFAFRVKNLVRPSGLARLRSACMLTGSGMAFPWAVLYSVPLVSDKLAEDVWLTIELAAQNQYVLLDAEARVFGTMPTSARGAQAQRTRWEHGHLENILHGVPLLIRAAWQQKKLAPLELMLDLAVPPLSLLLIIWLLVFCAGLGSSVLGAGNLPLAMSSLAGLLLISAIAAAWSKYGREQIPLTVLFSVPLYVLFKLPLYGAFLVRRQHLWERSERD